MNRLFEIAAELNEVNISRMDYRRKLQTIERDRKAYEFQMIPEGGWPGKNADERKAAEMIAKANDGQLYGYEVQRQTVEFNLDNEELRREALIAERDAWTWTIRDNETVAVGMRSAFVAYSVWLNGEPPPETAKIETPVSIADLEESKRDNAAAASRLAEMHDLDVACMWELPLHAAPQTARDARARNQELQELQDAYEAKYHL